MILFIAGCFTGVVFTVFAFALANISGRDKRENE